MSKKCIECERLINDPNCSGDESDCECCWCGREDRGA